ncbi:hypothetical protein AO073_14545 [Pseudomonas syringae ICMP 11293]|uniref:hypothetical protein n=1 Tax=Pseudomonas syringae TaxID=317 RepID=UPI000730871A|nr:hypothetical protein [Pseudomonas syringae]KTB95075.1 hypothetical protein AO073_14545 [Pseudomonas syringae ICMP 11293]
MSLEEDFRFKSHELLVELDASIAKLMMMVSAKEAVGVSWADATLRHHEAFIAWHEFLGSSNPSLRYNLVIT